MNRIEIKEFKKFLNERNIFMMFSQNYRNHHLTVNPSTMEAYLEKVKAENVIPLAFVYLRQGFLAGHPRGMEQASQPTENRPQRNGTVRLSGSGDHRRQGKELFSGSAEEHLFAEPQRRQPVDSQHRTLEDGGQETLYPHASDP